jgi:hypothetical protein
MDPSDRSIYQQVWPTIYKRVKGRQRTQHQWATLVDKLQKKKKKKKKREKAAVVEYELNGIHFPTKKLAAALLLLFSILLLDFSAAHRL